MAADGLAAGLCTRDIGNALRISNDLDAGTVWINCYDNFDMACPFGGTKESGWGREKGQYALDNYTEARPAPSKGRARGPGAFLVGTARRGCVALESKRCRWQRLEANGAVFGLAERY